MAAKVGIVMSVLQGSCGERVRFVCGWFGGF
jgi:hypothetical protein